MKITIVTPSFQQAEFLEATLRSVIEQGYPELEYIVMDGGSTDGSKAIIERYAGQLAHWQSERDGGQAVALRAAFARATGDVLGWINSDDQLLPGALATVAEAFRDPTVEWVSGACRVVQPDGREETLRPDFGAGLADWLIYIRAGQQACFWRRGLYERVGGVDASLTYAMDQDLFIRFLLTGAKVGVLEQELGTYRMHAANKTFGSQYPAMLEPLTRVVPRYARSLPADQRRKLRRNLARRELQLARLAALGASLPRCAWHVVRGIVRSPFAVLDEVARFAIRRLGFR